MAAGNARLGAGGVFRRRTPVYVRQGEWFFVPAPQVRPQRWMVLRNEPLRRGNGKPHWAEQLFRQTGATPDCKSEWGSDAAYDMVGNLDEWVDDPKGLFLGGFFSRSTREGCESSISAHPRPYFDYSTGTRCCK